MTIVKYTAEEIAEMESQTDWQRVDAMTDGEIARAVESDPDARLLIDEDFKRMRRRGPQKALINAIRTILRESCEWR